MKITEEMVLKAISTHDQSIVKMVLERYDEERLVVNVSDEPILNVPVTKKWYEDIPEQGVLCWTGGDRVAACIVSGYNEEAGYPFWCRGGAANRKNPIPMTDDEIKSFLSKPVDETPWYFKDGAFDEPVECYVSALKDPTETIEDMHKANIVAVLGSASNPIFNCERGIYDWYFAQPVK